MASSASPAPIASVLTATATPPPSAGGAPSGASSADFAQLMHGAIARQSAPNATSAASPATAATATPTGDATATAASGAAPTAQSLRDTLQQLVAQSQQPNLTPAEAAALQTQWQAFSQQLSAWMSSQRAGAEGAATAADASADGQAFWAKMRVQLQGKPEGQGQDATSGELAWLAALQHLATMAGVPAGAAASAANGLERAGAAFMGSAQSPLQSQLPSQAQLQSQTQFQPQAQGQAQSLMSPAGSQTAITDGSLTKSLLSPSDNALSSTAQAVFAQLVSARTSDTPAPTDATSSLLSNGLSILPAGFSVANGALTAAPLPQPPPLMLQQPDSGGQLGQNIQWVLGQNLSRASLSVHPEHLGPLQITIDHKNDQTSIQITATHPMARDLLDQQLPKLREWLQEAGLGNAQVSLNMGQFGQQHPGQSAGQPSAQSGQGRGAENGVLTGGSDTETASVPTDAVTLSGRITRLGVDTFI